MRSIVRFAAAHIALLMLAACGAIYTSPNVFPAGNNEGYNAETDYQVDVVPLTLATALEANLSEYVPARLPQSFTPTSSAPPPQVARRSTAMPDIPTPSAATKASPGIAGVEGPLPPAATALPSPERAEIVRLPGPEEPVPYRIGVADVLLLSANTAGATLDDVPTLLSAQSARQGYIVQDDGAIAIPDVGRVAVADLTLEEAEAEIFDALVAQRLDPSFSLEIAEFNSQRVSVGGAVAAPSVQPISLKPLYLSEALQISGGVTSEDLDYAIVRLYRDGEIYEAPVRRLYADDRLTDVLLKDGDSLFVDVDYDLRQARAYFEEQLRLRDAELRDREFEFRQRQADIDEVRFGITVAQFELQKAQLRQQLASMEISFANYQVQRNVELRAQAAAERALFRERVELGAVERDRVYVVGELRRPRTQLLPFERRANLSDVLFSEGGFTPNFSDYGEIYVIRQKDGFRTVGAVTAYHLNAKNIVNVTTASQFEMRPNDVVFIAEQPVTVWSRVISQIIPTLIGQGLSVATATGAI